MSNKLTLLKKKLLKETILVFGFLAVLGGIVGASSYFIHQRQAKAQSLQSQLSSTTGELNGLERKNELIKDSISDFVQIKKDVADGNYSLDREKAREILTEISKSHRVNIDTKISPIEKLNLPDATFARAEPRFCDVKLSFKAMSDMHVYDFLDSLMKKLPGIKKVVSFKITRNSSVSDDSLLQISQGKTPELVAAEIDFLWIGLKIIPVGGDAAATPASGAHTP